MAVTSPGCPLLEEVRLFEFASNNSTWPVSPTANSLPSGDHVTSCKPETLNAPICRPLLAFSMRTWLSLPATARRCPSGDHARPQKTTFPPLKFEIVLPLVGFHT